ncbi:AbrB/MazE/SpoVT family DNA-binding domain-containing protein [Candidatus Peregrinibacteria bacterium CG10_big_fil_rev_8_21_14_0_10_42_8]|nr:MAG: AbrB/MazE/SpoVT family DNA-binding domain-containing protein [Candidatus Peregrinibacteria bacterium CG10_big_fil_rev_8_21_14_0_10_42_8]
MKLHIRKWGNSLGLRIPKVFTEQLDIQEGNELELFAHKNTLILSKSTPSLDALLEQVHESNMHSETDFGSIQGVEAW